MEQQGWLIAHLLLDTGVSPCPQCQTLGSTPYCVDCGTRRTPVAAAPRRCAVCGSESATAYCGECGGVLVTSAERAIDAGTFDWEQWEAGLSPFLGGLTEADAAQLASLGQG